jgi:alkylation response protein AidB-like acyl-CoA dehydrogenase
MEDKMATGTMDRPKAETLAETAARLSAEFETRAAAHDLDDSFVAENFARLKEEGLVSAAVPAELGGGGASITELGEMLRILGRGCASTALALAMHTHQVATAAWRWRNAPPAKAAVEPLLRRIAAERIVLVTSGGSDWIGSSGKAEKVEGGWRVSAQKAFASASPVGDLFMTTAIGGDKILHFGTPFNDQVKRKDNWRTLGMRGTGSGAVEIDGLFVPDDKVALLRPAGEWHPLWQIIATTAIPLIYCVYLGVAEAARDIALDLVRKRPGASRRLVGEMDAALWTARAVMQAGVAVAELPVRSYETVNEAMLARRQAEVSVLRTVELAMELAGGPGFFRAAGLERRFRDVQGARYHPMRRELQETFSGAMALGEDVSRIY